MFKIKDSVDLKELKKFGFKEISTLDNYGMPVIIYKKYKQALSYKMFIEITEKREVLYGVSFKKNFGFIFKNIKIDAKKIEKKLFKNLIKADLVEKVEE